ncbi:hypothetical protein [Massilia rubra]|uniref:Uncharacterized protein n=1 Tax=Massilia rubra TaxID=2607910 RepID=A0ABX0M0I3_9BURK|nr:hypothetical protein [Massilia rubra]NHZ37847.1 hypothetical protein [Massilia rubra]
MKKQVSRTRSAQKQAIELGNVVGGAASAVMTWSINGLQKLDAELLITDKVKNVGDQIGSLGRKVDQHIDISGKASVAKSAIAVAVVKAERSASAAAENIGLNKAGTFVGEHFDTFVARPTTELASEYEVGKKFQMVGSVLGGMYGHTRETIKPYFQAENAHKLLSNTRAELNYISACIMQISPDDAHKAASQFGAVVASKISGLATTASLLALVSTYGTAGTGTAIASLSGAAATNATLAWVGGLLGGGMAAGAALTGGLTIVVGLGAYKLLGSERRAFDDLSDEEQRIVQYCWFLISMIDDFLVDKEFIVSSQLASELLNNTLLPLHTMLIEHADQICASLDTKNAVAYRQHVLVDFKRVVIDGFGDYVISSGTRTTIDLEHLIGGVFYALLTRTAVDDSPESRLVLDALRRSSRALNDADEYELSEYLGGLEAHQIKGAASNVKGIYHELLFVKNYNAAHTDTYAEVYAATNRPGADVVIKSSSTHESLNSFQLKATDSSAYVKQHVSRYPDIEVHVTRETAEQMEGVHSSGIDNADISERVKHDLDALVANTLGSRICSAAERSAVVATGQELLAMLNGKKAFPESVVDTVRKVGTATVATAISAYIFH